MQCPARTERTHYAECTRQKILAHYRDAVGYSVNDGEVCDRAFTHVPNWSPIHMPRPRAHSDDRILLLPDG